MFAISNCHGGDSYITAAVVLAETWRPALDVFIPGRTALARNRPARLFFYLVEASRERSPTAKQKFGALPSRRSKKVREIGQMTVLEKDIVSNSHL